MLNKIRLIILLVVGVPALLIGGGIAAYTAIAGDGEITVVAPPDVALKYTVDNGAAQTLAAGNHGTLKAKQGEHTVTIDFGDGPTSRKFKISSGFANMLVPGKGQCFLLLDVAKSHYDYGHGTAKFPSVDKKIADDQPFDLPGSLYFSEASLPSSLKEGNSCNLLTEVPCEALKGSDAEVLKAAGYE